MITDTFKRGAVYSLGSLWNALYPDLMKLVSQGESLKEGNYPLAGGPDNGGVMAIVSAYETKPETETRYEGHDRMADIQAVLAGDEYLDMFPLMGGEKESMRDDQRDLVFYEDKPAGATRVHLVPGVFALVLPGEAHMPCIRGTSERVKKLVVKIPAKDLAAPSTI